jgi:hypothetical protein
MRQPGCHLGGVPTNPSVDYSEISATIWNIPEEGRNEKKKSVFRSAVCGDSECLSLIQNVLGVIG